MPDEDLYPGFSASGQDVWLDTWDHEGEAIVVSAVGARCGKAFLSEGRWSAIANTHVVEPLSEALNPKFLWYRLNDERFWIRSGTAQPFVKVGKTLEREFAFPPVSEQHRIVEAIESYLTRLDAAVVSLEQVQKNLKRYRASVLKAAVEGRLVPTEAELARKEGRSYEPASELLNRILDERRKKWIENAAEKARAKTEEKAHKAGKPWSFKDDAKTLEKERAKAATKYKEPAAPDLSALGAQAGTTNLPNLPEGWCWAGPDQLADDSPYSLGIGPFGSNLRTVDYRDSGVPLVFVRNIRTAKFESLDDKFVNQDKADELRPHWVEPGDVLVTKMGDPPGDACLYPLSRPPAVITADCIKLRAKPKLAIGAYVVTAIRSRVVQHQIGRITKGVAQKKVSLARFKTIGIPLPPKPEQEQVQAHIQMRNSQIDACLKAVTLAHGRCARLRQSVLKWAFEGKLVEQDPNDEPASVLLERIKAKREPTQQRKRQQTKKNKPTKHDEQLDLLGGRNT